MSYHPRPRGAHMVGSVPFTSNADVFRTVTQHLGTHLRRIPDGETGERGGFIGWQIPQFMKVVEYVQEHSTAAGMPGEDIALPELSLPPLGYAAEALASYAVFAALREQGVIPTNTRFQVSLPTPIALVHALVHDGNQRAVEYVHASCMQSEIETITTSIPHNDLAIQWDTPIEFAILEGMMPTYYADPRQAIQERLLRWGSWVPENVELGYHLCYGDNDGQHFKEPSDTALLVEIANEIAAQLARPLHWIHLPVPQNRLDAAYYAPLANLRLRTETELYLGLVHLADGVPGTQRRIVAAQQFIHDFGVATECGLGRRAPETIPALLDLHAAVAEPWEAHNATTGAQQ